MIREIFARYPTLGSVTRLAIELRDTVVVPERVNGGRRSSGGKPFSRGHLYAILQNLSMWASSPTPRQGR